MRNAQDIQCIIEREAKFPKYKMYYAKMQGRGLGKEARQRPT
jgi:hypothetical protein